MIIQCRKDKDIIHRYSTVQNLTAYKNGHVLSVHRCALLPCNNTISNWSENVHVSVAVTIEWLHMASVVVELTIDLYCSSSLAILPPYSRSTCVKFLTALC